MRKYIYFMFLMSFFDYNILFLCFVMQHTPAVSCPIFLKIAVFPYACCVVSESHVIIMLHSMDKAFCYHWRIFGFAQWIYINFSSLNSGILAFAKLQRSCGRPQFILCFDISGWKVMLEFLIISFSTIDFIWARTTFMASLWCLAYGLFHGVLLSDIQRDWHALLHGLFT